MRLRTSAILAILSLLAAWGAGCGSKGFLLPDEKKWAAQWETFDQAKAAFDQVVPQQTSRKELKALGFDPYVNPNIALLSYVGVFQRFHPTAGFSLDHHDPAIRQCFEARENCTGLEVSSRRFRDKEHGNVLLSMLTFRRQTTMTQWSFRALIILVDDQVVYKLWEGAPTVVTETDRIRPLGPLTDPSFLLGF